MTVHAPNILARIRFDAYTLLSTKVNIVDKGVPVKLRRQVLRPITIN